nr:MAG TPA: hypothetical protein [Caudoviricetes sp.]
MNNLTGLRLHPATEYVKRACLRAPTHSRPSPLT